MQDDAIIISSLDSEKKVGGVVYDQDFDAKKQVYTSNATPSYSSPTFRGNTLPAYYDSREEEFSRNAGLGHSSN